jgi:hypothetical protein
VTSLPKQKLAPPPHKAVAAIQIRELQINCRRQQTPP